MYAQRESEELPYLITSFYCLMYYYSFVSVKWEYLNSLDNYKRSICISFSACLGNGVPSPLHWPTPAELALFNNTLLIKNWEKDQTFTTCTKYLKLKIVFCDFWTENMFDLQFSWTDFMDINHMALLGAMCFLM